MNPLRLAGLFALSTLLAPVSAPGSLEVSLSVFDDALEPHGYWRENSEYGRVWQPRGVDREWTPYSDGQWVYTDAGWTWDSDEPYGWAVYHYGRWANVTGTGWVWVPGTEWGPGWVSWRQSPHHVGWAALPPRAVFSRSRGFHARVDDDYGIDPGNYRFVSWGDIGSPRLRNAFVPRRESLTIIRETTNITNITYNNNNVRNHGPDYDEMARASTRPIKRLRLEREDQRSRTDGTKSRVRGDAFQVLALPSDAITRVPPQTASKSDRPDSRQDPPDAGRSDDPAKRHSTSDDASTKKVRAIDGEPARVPPPASKPDDASESKVRHINGDSSGLPPAPRKVVPTRTTDVTAPRKPVKDPDPRSATPPRKSIPVTTQPPGRDPKSPSKQAEPRKPSRPEPMAVSPPQKERKVALTQQQQAPAKQPAKASQGKDKGKKGQQTLTEEEVEALRAAGQNSGKKGKQ